MRASLEETPAFEAARERAPERRHLLGPVRDILVEEPRALGIALGVSIVWVIAVYTLIIYMPTYMQRSLGFPPSEVFTASVVGNIAMACGCIAAGRIADRFGRVRTVRLGALLLLALLFAFADLAVGTLEVLLNRLDPLLGYFHLDWWSNMVTIAWWTSSKTDAERGSQAP